MIRRKLVFGLVLVLGFSCQKKGGSSEEESTTEEATADQSTGGTTDAAQPVVEGPATPNDFLVGRWVSDCVNQPEFLQASYIVQYEFLADGNANSKTISYAGVECTRRFTKPDVDKLIEQINAERVTAGTPALSNAELASLNALWFPPPAPFTFKLGRTLKDTTVEMNATQTLGEQTINSYLTIYVKDDFLYFAALCSKQDLDNGACSQIVGDSVKNRARDLSKAIPFHKI